MRETIAAVVILALLVMLLAPWMLSRQAKSRQTMCRERLRKLWSAAKNYEETAGRYPTYQARWKDDADQQQPLISWVGALVPHLDADSGGAVLPQVENLLKTKQGPQNPLDSIDLREIYLRELMCPTDLRVQGDKFAAYLSFVANTGMPDAQATESAPADWPANGLLTSAEDLQILEKIMIPAPSFATIEQHDGANQTLMFAENIDAGNWTDAEEPKVGFVWFDSVVKVVPQLDEKLLLGINRLAGKGDGSYRFARPAAFHGRGVNVVYCSGQLQFMSESIDYIVFANLMNSDIHSTKKPGSDQPLAEPYRLFNE